MDERQISRCNQWLYAIWIALPIGAVTFATTIEYSCSGLLILFWIVGIYLAAERVIEPYRVERKARRAAYLEKIKSRRPRPQDAP